MTVNKTVQDRLTVSIFTLITGALVYFITLVFELKDEVIKIQAERKIEIKATEKRIYDVDKTFTNLFDKYDKSQEDARKELKYLYEQLHKK